MSLSERYLTALHLLVSAVAIGFSINGDDGAVIFCQLTACMLALVLFEKILTRFLIGTAAVFLPMVAWGAMLIKYSPGVYISQQYQERGVLAFVGDAIAAVIVGIVIALLGVLFHKAKRHLIAKRAGRKKPLISPVWVCLAVIWIVFIPFFYAWAISSKFDFEHYVFFLDKRVNTFAWPIVTAISGLILYAVLVAIRSQNVTYLKEVLPAEKHVDVTGVAAEELRHFSKGGMIVTVVCVVTGIAGLSGGISWVGIFPWMGAAVAMLIRTFRLPLGWKQGLATFLGGLLAGAAVMNLLLSAPAIGAVGVIGASVIMMVLSIFILRAGFRRV